MTDQGAGATDRAIPFLQEYLTLGHREVEAGHVRVHLATTTEDRTLHAPVNHQRAEVQRIAIGRVVAEAPGIREEEDGAVLVVPVLEEILVTERRIVLKEEIRIRRVTTTENVETTVALHSQAATIERLPPESQAVTEPDRNVLRRTEEAFEDDRATGEGMPAPPQAAGETPARPATTGLRR